MNIQNLLILIAIILVLSNIKYIRKYFLVIKNKKYEYFSNKTNINYNVYINNYQDIANNNVLYSYFKELIDVESIDDCLSIDEIKNNSIILSCINNYKPIASICICKIDVLKKLFDKYGLTETYINPIQNGYFVYNYLLDKKFIDNKFEYYQILLKEVEKWAESPAQYDCNTNILSQSNFISNNIYFVNDKVYKNLPKANFILVFGIKLPEYKINGTKYIHNKISQLVYNNQYVLDWSKKSVLNKLFNISPTSSENIYIKHRPHSEYPYIDNFNINKNEFLVKNGYTETAYKFINNKTFYIKYIPRNICLYRSRQVSVINNEPYNY